MKYIEDFIEENGLSKEYVQNHIGTFHHVEESRKLCENCKGLYTCNQKSIGQRLALRYEDVLIETIENCSYRLSKDEYEELKNAYVYSDIAEHCYSLSLKNVELPDEEIKKYCAKVLSIYQGTSDKGLFVVGDMGTGKTYMMMALANSLVMKGKKVAFLKTIDFVNEMRKEVACNDGEYEAIMARLKKCDVLIIDDIGAESVSAFSRDDLLFNILDYRMEHKLLTCFTSNYDKNSLLEHYTFTKGGKSETLQAKRLLERIDILSDVYILKGQNRRRLK